MPLLASAPAFVAVPSWRPLQRNCGDVSMTLGLRLCGDARSETLLDASLGIWDHNVGNYAGPLQYQPGYMPAVWSADDTEEN